MVKEYLSISGLSYFLSKLPEKFSTVQHTHTQTEITDFPTIPTKISELTDDMNLVSMFTVTDDDNGNVVINWE